MFSLDSVGFLLIGEEFHFFHYLLSEVANYFYLLLVLTFLTYFKVLDKKYFIFWAVYFSSPFFTTYVMFDEHFMGDQGIYLATVNNNIIYGLGSVAEISNGISGLLTQKVQVASNFMSMIPMVSYLSVTSLAFINKLIVLIFFIFMKSRISLDKLIYFFLIPSFILFSSVGLRDTLIMSFTSIALILIIERKIILSLVTLILASLIKTQLGPGLIIVWLLMFILRADKYFIVYVISSILGLICIILFFDFYADILNLYRAAFAIEDCVGGYRFCTDVSAESITIKNGFELMWVSLISTLPFLLKPLPWEITSAFQLVVMVESFILLYFLYIIVIEKETYRENVFWVLFTGFIITMTLFAITSFNLGTLHRYRFGGFFPYLLAFYYLSLQSDRTSNERIN